MITLRNPRTGQAIDVDAPDRATAVAMLRHAYPNGVPSNADIAPIQATAPVSSAHPQGGVNWGDWGRSAVGGLAQGANVSAAPVGAADETVDRLADMAARGAHSFGQMVGLVPHEQPYDPSKTAALMHTVRQPWEDAAQLTAKALAASGNHDLAGVTLGVANTHPRDVENATVSAANSLAGPQAGTAVRAAEDYTPQTTGGRIVYRAASMLPAALSPGSATQRALAVLAPTLGSTVAGEGARALGASPETTANAELVAGLLSMGAGHAATPLAENAVTNVGDLVAGLRGVPTSGSAADLTGLLKGGARVSGADDVPTFKRSDLKGAANILAQHVARVSRANGEDFAGMTGRVAGMGGQGMLADVLPDLARQVADRGSYGQQFLGNQLNERQLGVRDDATGSWTSPSQSMRLQDAYAGALGVPAGVAPFDYLKGIEDARNASAATNYRTAYAQPPVQVSSTTGSISPTWRGLANAHPTVQTSPFSEYSASPAWNEAYARARKISGVEPIDNGDGTFSIQELPKAMPDTLDWRTLDLMKRGIGDMVDEAPSKGLGSTYAGMLGDYLKRLTAAQGDLNPDIASARADYAAPSQLMDAATLGSTFRNGNVSPAEIAWHLSQSDPNQTIGLQVGHYNSAQPVFDGSTRFNAAERLGATSPGAFEKDNLLIGDPDTAADWQRLLGNENTFFGTKQRVLGGSLTSRNSLGAEDAADLEGVNPFEATAGAVRALHGDLDGVVETAGNAGKLSGLSKLFQARPSQMTEGTADVLGTILGTRGAFMDPQTAALIQGLMDSARGPNYSAGIVRPAALLSAPKNQDQGGDSAP
jgi:hypothetical protein